MKKIEVKTVSGRVMEYKADDFRVWDGELHIFNGMREDMVILLTVAPGQWEYVREVVDEQKRS